MIFVLHYILFNAGLPATLILLTLFLQTYSPASLSEIGALLMALPFLSILIKPLFCALADRQQAHRAYLMGALAFMAAGYGSLAIAPFFPDLIAQQGRLVWWLDILAIVVGFSAFGVVWSLGDALAVNAAQVNNVSWGSYRVWAVISWGLFGIIIGQINELPFLPKYVPALFLLVASLLLEILLLAVWPSRHFVMAMEPTAPVPGLEDGAGGLRPKALEELVEANGGAGETSWTDNRSLTGTLSGTARANPRLIGAVANIFMEDLGGTLKSSLKLGTGRFKRAGLAEILEQHQLSGGPALSSSSSQQVAVNGSSAASQQQTPLRQALGPASPAGTLRRQRALQASGSSPSSPATTKSAHSTLASQFQDPAARQPTPASGGSRPTTMGRAALRRTQAALARMNSLGAASGHAISSAAELELGPSELGLAGDCSAAGTPLSGGLGQHHQVMYMSSLASNASLSRALGLGANQSSPMSSLGGLSCSETLAPVEESGAKAAPTTTTTFAATTTEAEQSKRADDLQLVLLKLIIQRDSNIWKYLVMFTLFGVLLTCHLSYFFLNLEQLCRDKGVDFSSVTGAMMAAHSISEVLSFTLIVPHFVPQVGRTGALLSCAVVYAIRFAYYGTYLAHLSPFTGVPFELCHGIAYGIIYSLITDIAVECVNHVDVYLPELVERGIVESTMHPNRLKLPLRATMQGVFSGAFDGLGNGIGALFGGLYLDAHPFASLWLFCFYLCLAIIILYPLTEWRQLCRRSPSADCPLAADNNKTATRNGELELAEKRPPAS